MSKSTILKAATLFSSISLVLVFLLFRSGYFSTSEIGLNSLQTSPNGGAVTTVAQDTIPRDSSLSPVLSSSKVLILRDRKIQPKKAIIKRNKAVDTSKKENSYLWTSKSGRIFETVSPRKDSSKSVSDTIKTKGKQ